MYIHPLGRKPNLHPRSPKQDYGFRVILPVYIYMYICLCIYIYKYIFFSS